MDTDDEYYDTQDYLEYTTALLDFDPTLAVIEAGDDLDLLEALEQFGLRLTDYTEKGGGKRHKRKLPPRGTKDNPNEILKFEPYLGLMVAHFLNDVQTLDKLTDFGWALIDTSIISQKRVSNYSEMEQGQEEQQDKKRKERTHDDCGLLGESQEGENNEEKGDDFDKEGPLGLIIKKKKKAKVRDSPNDNDDNSIARSPSLSSSTKPPPASSLEQQGSPSSSSSSSSSSSQSSSSSEKQEGSASSSSLSGSLDTTAVNDDDKEEDGDEEEEQEGEITKQQQKQQHHQPPFRACEKSTTTSYDSEPGEKQASSSDDKRQPQRLQKNTPDNQQSPSPVGTTLHSPQGEEEGTAISSNFAPGGKPVSSGDQQQQQPQCSSNRFQMVIHRDGPRRHRDWNDNYERLKQFKADNGHCRVPQIYDDDPPLGLWVSRQRVNNNKGSLAPDRKEKLNKIGFIWTTRKYIYRRHLTIATQIATRPIFGLCQEAVPPSGGSKFLRWWQQDHTPAANDEEEEDNDDDDDDTDDEVD